MLYDIIITLNGVARQAGTTPHPVEGVLLNFFGFIFLSILVYVFWAWMAWRL